VHYAIIDIETTGGNHRSEKITEIAIYIFDGERIIDEFTTLINPEKRIPVFISQLTGITNEMVENAPKFFEVAKEIILKTEDTIFVAHNVNFDYSFIKAEFKQLGYNYSRNTLDTVKLSRKLLPGHKSYSLGTLCDDLGISINGRHRATGDALATVKLFEILLKKGSNFDEEAFPEKYKWLKGINDAWQREIIINLPDKTGVYYFLNSQHQLIYIGKSKSIKQRVAQHFSNDKSKKAIELRSQIAEVNYQITGSELVALLLESDEIKKHKPLYNRAQRQSIMNHGIFVRYNLNGYIELLIDRITKKQGDPIASFNNKADAVNFMNHQLDDYDLCQKLCGVYPNDSSCFYYEIKKCKGACIGKESATDYNKRATRFIHELNLNQNSYYIIDQGRESNEAAIIKIDHGKYIGFGFLTNDNLLNTDLINKSIKIYQSNKDVQQIIKNAIHNNQYKIVPIND